MIKKPGIKSTLTYVKPTIEDLSDEDGNLVVDISGYHLILNEIKSIIQAEPLGEGQKDSLLSKIESIQDILLFLTKNDEERKFQERRLGHEYNEVNDDNSS